MNNEIEYQNDSGIEKMDKKKIITRKKLLLLSLLLFYYSIGYKNSYDKKFRDYLKEKYNIELNEKSNISRCGEIGKSDRCDYYGVYTISNDNNYAIQIMNKSGEFTDSYDKDVFSRRSQLLDYITKIKGNSFTNYLGFEANTCSAGYDLWNTFKKSFVYNDLQ